MNVGNVIYWVVFLFFYLNVSVIGVIKNFYIFYVWIKFFLLGLMGY